MTEVKKEGLVFISLNKVHSFEIQPVSEIFIFTESILGQIEPADVLIPKNVWPEVGSVANSFDLTPDVPGKAVIDRPYFKLGIVVPVTGQVPLADHACRVTVAFQDVRERDLAGRQRVRRVRPQVVENADSCWMLPRQQRRTVRRADRCGGVRIGETHPLFREPVQMRRLMERVSVAAEFGPAEIVGQHEDDVWLPRLFSRLRACGQAQYSKRQC